MDRDTTMKKSFGDTEIKDHHKSRQQNQETQEIPSARGNINTNDAVSPPQLSARQIIEPNFGNVKGSQDSIEQ